MPKRNPILPIILTAFLDMLGIGIVIPILAPLIVGNETGMFTADFSLSSRHIVMGIMMACFPLAQFFGAPILGALSDRHGRKKIILLSQLGSCLGWIIFAYGISTSNIYLLFISRTFDGFTGGNVAVIFSAVSDITSKKERPKNFGLIGMTFGLGFILGPALGGQLSNSDFVSWFTMTTPFLFTAGLYAFNMIWVLIAFPETLKTPQQTEVHILTGIRNIKLAFSLMNLRALLITLFFLTLGFSFFTQFFHVFLVEKFGFGPTEIGLLFSWIGLWIAFAQGGLVRILAKWVAPEKVVKVAALGLGISLPIIMMPSEVWLLYAVCPLIAFTQGIMAPNLTSLISYQATSDQQGSILGINQSIQSLGQAVPPIIAGFLSGINIHYPTLAGSVFIIIGWLLFLLFYRKTGELKNSDSSGKA